jgi:thioredoxin reductase (NADPH)
MTETTAYEVVIVGGGPAGLSAALYTTRLGHKTAVVDRGGGRAAMMQDTHNVIGVTENVSGMEFLQTGREQVESYGADWHQDFVEQAAATDEGVVLETASGTTLVADRVVLATGFSDIKPDPPLPRTGAGLHYCLHCDAYMFVEEDVYVMGHSDSAAYVAMIMLNFASSVDLLLRGDEPTWSDETDELIRAHPVEIIDEEVVEMTNGQDGWLESLSFADGTTRAYRGGFAVYGSEYSTELAEELGCRLNDDGTVAAGDHGKTDVEGVYAIGDLTPGHNQVPIALAEGARAGIDIHMDLRTYPRPLEEIEGTPGQEIDVPAVPEAIRDAAAARSGSD